MNILNTPPSPMFTFCISLLNVVVSKIIEKYIIEKYTEMISHRDNL